MNLKHEPAQRTKVSHHWDSFSKLSLLENTPLGQLGPGSSSSAPISCFATVKQYEKVLRVTALERPPGEV